MKAKLYNSLNCLLEEMDAKNIDELIRLISDCWLPTIDDGDKIIFSRTDDEEPC